MEIRDTDQKNSDIDPKKADEHGQLDTAATQASGERDTMPGQRTQAGSHSASTGGTSFADERDTRGEAGAPEDERG